MGKWLVSNPAGIIVLFGVVPAVIIVGTAGMWKTLKKGGLAGSNASMPMLNMRAFIRLAGLEHWKIPPLALLLGPLLLCYVPLCVARRFGKGRLFGLGLLFLPFVFYPILGFGNAQYLGPPSDKRHFTPHDTSTS